MWLMRTRRGVTPLLLAAVVAGAVASASAPVPVAAARGAGVGVVDFYALSVLPPLLGVFPEQLAADDLAALVARPSATPIPVIPRDAVRQAESAMGWQRSDVLRFARLQDLAHALNADFLVVGWINRLDMDREGGSFHGDPGLFFITGYITVTVQVFDPQQARIVSRVERSDSEVGTVRSFVAQRLIARAIEQTLPSILPIISGTR